MTIPLPPPASRPGARCDPFAFLDLAPPEAPRFAWRAFDGAAVHVAFGAACVASAQGAAALDAIAATVRAVRPRVFDGDGRPYRVRPRWFGGFAFDPTRPPAGSWDTFPAALFVLPAAQLAVGRSAARLTLCGPAGEVLALRARARDLARTILSMGLSPSAARRAVLPNVGPPSPIDSPDRALARRLERALRALEGGEVTKVVVATSLSAPLAGPVDVVSLARRAAAAAPGCTAFLVAPTPSAAWLGATPERLVRVRGRRLWTMALAGTARRGKGVRADGALGAALMASDKDRREHQAVVAAISEALHDVPGLTVAHDAAPQLRRLATLQHLETRVTARAEHRLDALAAARRLHPTPALAGWPRGAAQALIARLEPEGRGWYGGGVGWIDGAGDGDIAVGIRALLVGQGQATAFAGAGLVAGSDAGAEAREIGLKLAAALAPLGPRLDPGAHADPAEPGDGR